MLVLHMLFFRQYQILLLGLLWLLPTACSNFHIVERGKLYRSAQPSPGQLQDWIAEHDLKTVLRLRTGGSGQSSEKVGRQVAEAAGVQFTYLPMSATRDPGRQQLLALWELFETAEYPMLIHCKAGADRTGCASALYVLQRTGSVDLALRQLRFFPYLHLGMFGTEHMSAVFYSYRPYQHSMSFPDWVRQNYQVPAGVVDAVSPGPLARGRGLEAMVLPGFTTCTVR